MSAPEPDNARQELERAATRILSELTHRGELPSTWSYQQVHGLVAIAYGKGYVARGEYVSRLLEQGHERVMAALESLS